MVTTRRRNVKHNRLGVPWTEDADERLLAIAQLPPRRAADLMRRIWLACRRRLIYLRSDDSRILDSKTLRPSSAR